MQALIDSVATLVDMRDRDDLEFTLASVMLDLLRASAIAFWSIYQRDGLTLARERVRIQVDATIETPPPIVGIDEIALANLSREAQDAYETRQSAHSPLRDGAYGRHVFPLLVGSEVVGLAEIICRPALDGERQRMVSGLMQIYRSHLGILESSDTDELTGLFNRRPFDEMFRRYATEVVPASDRRKRRRDEISLSRAELAIADVDNFKRVNDTFGHPYGDEVLVLIARMMRESLRDSDRLFRFGGEEFVILLNNVDSFGAEAALERFRRAVEEFVFPQVGHVTISLGVTTIRPHETGSDAYGRADTALYQSKAQGRNLLRRYETLVGDGVIAQPDLVVQEIEVF